MSHQSKVSKCDSDSDITSSDSTGITGSENSTPLKFRKNQHVQQIDQTLQSGRSRQFHQSELFDQQTSNTIQRIVDESNPSLIYDRTIKVAKVNYADHGSHGVVGIPLPIRHIPHDISGEGMTSAIASEKTAGIHDTRLPPSMQMYMEHQIQQQWRQLIQNQNIQSSMLSQPPPSMALPQHVMQQSLYCSPYPPMVMKQVDSQQYFQPLQDRHGDGILNNSSNYSNASSAGLANTTSIQLIEAFNAHLAAAATASRAQSSNFTNNASNACTNNDGSMDEKGCRLMAHQMTASSSTPQGVVNNASCMNYSSSSSDVSFPNKGELYQSGMIGINELEKNTSSSSKSMLNHFTPLEVRNAKKRVSPSVPLHSRQLQLPHQSGGYLMSHTSSCMKSVNEVKGFLTDPSREKKYDQEDSAVKSVTVIDDQGMLPCLEKSKSNASNDHIDHAMNGTLIPSVEMPAQSQIPLNDQTLEFNNNQNCCTETNEPELISDTGVSNSIKLGEVLTNPSEPAANKGLDNSEGNLIVRRGDIFRVPMRNIHPHPPIAPKLKVKSSAAVVGKKHTEETIEYHVVNLLGQGTFAQVFHCVEKQTGKEVAVKIVKNKPAYTRQAAIEIDVFRKLNAEDTEREDSISLAEARRDTGRSSSKSSPALSCSKVVFEDSIIRLMCYFMHCSHLCLVFEMLGPNLYEMLKKRQFRGLPIDVVRTLVRQTIKGIKILGMKHIVHCDLKPENILLVQADTVEDVIARKAKNCLKYASKIHDSKVAVSDSPVSLYEDERQWIKLIDFGSACFEGQTNHTYIQSRFYRSPEVLIGLPYDSAIDLWSLGCVAAELFLGLPILPGVNEHDQLGRILEMIGSLPEWMLEKGSKSTKFYNVFENRNVCNPSGMDSSSGSHGSTAPVTWKFKSRQEYINFLTEEEKQSKGGLAKLEQQPTNRYFKEKKLEDVIMHYRTCNSKDDIEQLSLFIHFLKGVLDPDPFKRWTAHQASMHPFLTGSTLYRSRLAEVVGDSTRSAWKPYEIHWVPPWDPSICRRKLLVVQKSKERSPRTDRRPSDKGVHHTFPEETLREGADVYGTPLRNVKNLNLLSPSASVLSVTSQVAALADKMSLERVGGRISPPRSIESAAVLPQKQLSNISFIPNFSASVGDTSNVRHSMKFQQRKNIGTDLTGMAGRSFSENIHPSQDAIHNTFQSSFGLNSLAFMTQPPPQPTFTGAQSFSGVYYGLPSHYPHVESELGYALQRPGVFPISGNDSATILQKQSSILPMTFSPHQNLMPSYSWSNVSSIPSSYVQSSGSLTYQSPGGHYQPLGLHDQGIDNGSYAHPTLSQLNGRANVVTSLLAQQLAEYSEANQKQQQQQQHPSQPPMLNLHLEKPYFVRQHSMFSNTSDIYNCSGASYSGSYHSFSNNMASEGPLSLTSLPYLHSVKFDHSMNHQQQLYLAEINNFQSNGHNNMYSDDLHWNLGNEKSEQDINHNITSD